MESLVMRSFLQKYYLGKTVLITGHTGFKGSWLSFWLKTIGAKVVGYSLEPPSQPNLFETIDLERDIIHYYNDVRDFDSLSHIFFKHQPEIVFHLAAQPLVLFSYKEPRLTFETNVMGTVNVFEAVRQTRSVRAMVNVTSDKCYENKEWVWGYRENDPMGGHDPYSSSKGCAELVTSAYLFSFFPPESFGNQHHTAVASVRSGNIIGGGDFIEDRLLPDCLLALSRGEDIVVRHPKAVRSWQYILAPIFGYLSLGAKLWEHGPRFNGGWNFGSITEFVWTVEDVVKEVCRLWGKGNYLISTAKNLHEAKWLKLDCSKSTIKLGWRPKYSIKQALQHTVEWYRKYYGTNDKAMIKAFTLQQIEEYERYYSR